MAEHNHTKLQYLTDEQLIIRHSGEIPEVAYHGSMYYLTEDPEGPGLELSTEDLHCLEEMVVERYRTIMLRDLAPENRDKSLYRGLARCAVNWQRLCKFSEQKHIYIDAVRAEIAESLEAFLQREVKECKNRDRSSSINCPPETLYFFARDLGLDPENFPPDLEHLCCQKQD